MARIRSIKPEFFRHEGLFEAERETGLPLRVAFAGLWTAADKEGRFNWKPRQLKLDALPYDDVDFSRVLDALMTRGFLVKYVVAGAVYGCIPSWKEHQFINNRELESSIPSVEEGSIESTTCTRDARVNDASITRQGNFQGEGEGEGKGKDREGRAKRASPPDRPESVDAQVWSDWLQLRARKRAPVTATVLGGAITEAAKAGVPLEQFLRIWCSRGSQGLEAAWLKPAERGDVRSFDQQRIADKRHEVAKWTGGILGKQTPENVIDMEAANAQKRLG